MSGTETDEVKYLSEDFSDKLKLLGFDPGCPVYEVTIDFKPKRLMRALFRQSWKKPILLPLQVEEHIGPTTDVWPLPMVVESVQAVYLPHAMGVDEQPVGCFNQPEWFVRGFVHKSPFDPYAQLIRMNVLMQTDPDGEFDLGYLQVLRNSSGVGPDARMLWGKGAPGQPT